jgi:hypothetical protein
MPREIITLQVGQCGNQSEPRPLLSPFHRCTVLCVALFIQDHCEFWSSWAGPLLLNRSCAVPVPSKCKCCSQSDEPTSPHVYVLMHRVRWQSDMNSGSSSVLNMALLRFPPALLPSVVRPSLFSCTVLCRIFVGAFSPFLPEFRMCGV